MWPSSSSDTFCLTKVTHHPVTLTPAFLTHIINQATPFCLSHCALHMSLTNLLSSNPSFHTTCHTTLTCMKTRFNKIRSLTMKIYTCTHLEPLRFTFKMTKTDTWLLLQLGWTYIIQNQGYLGHEKYLVVDIHAVGPDTAKWINEIAVLDGGVSATNLGLTYQPQTLS